MWILAGPQNEPKTCQGFNKRILQQDSTLCGDEKVAEIKSGGIMARVHTAKQIIH